MTETVLVPMEAQKFFDRLSTTCKSCGKFPGNHRFCVHRGLGGAKVTALSLAKRRCFVWVSEEQLEERKRRQKEKERESRRAYYARHEIRERKRIYDREWLRGRREAPRVE